MIEAISGHIIKSDVELSLAKLSQEDLEEQIKEERKID